MSLILKLKDQKTESTSFVHTSRPGVVIGKDGEAS